MQHNAEEMGRAVFCFPNAKVEVLALYALGHTQKRVAEELFITQEHRARRTSSASTRRRGCTPRQEIIDYLKQYAS